MSSSSMDDEKPFLGDFKERDHYEPLDDSLRASQYRRAERRRVLPWKISTGIFAATTLALLTWLAAAWSYVGPSKFGSFESGYHTELEPAKKAIELQRVKFTGELKFHENGTMYRDWGEGQLRYFGPPTQEIEDAWEELLYSSGIDLAGEEAETVKDIAWEEPMGGLWRTGLDVFHVLHCLNFVRRSLDLEYYNITDPQRLYLLHRDHCLDYIRQSIMCHADATPVHLKWRKASHYLIPKFDGYHTCRNFELLHDWSKQHALENNRDEAERLIAEQVELGNL